MVDLEVAQDLGVVSNGPETQGSEDPLAQYHRTSRILVILASDQDDRDLIRQRHLNAQARAGFADRDLVIVEFRGTHPGTAALRERLSASHGEFRAFLVGKDARVKQVWEHPIRPKELFVAIDAMPMRQSEMRERGAGVTSRNHKE
jgi:hypothetical protein